MALRVLSFSFRVSKTDISAQVRMFILPFVVIIMTSDYIFPVLLLAYMNGHGNLCRTLVKSGASVGAMNKHGITIFNYQVATKQLLHRYNYIYFLISFFKL